ncbi:hypothetical protein D3H35_21145 [Cohnella faecalis]|uniref:Uncharacterized protein n=2 Tax=Cohnella faecalis TaxID=2315694 RepID=A0A398CP61_9BACL|nr:hypothetical protein D3H35_21145 [Cohnella faecalis]
MKLFLLIFCSILACVVTLGIFSYSKSSSIIKNKVAEASRQTAEQAAGKFSLLFDGYERLSLQFITDSGFTDLINTLAAANDDYEKFDMSRKLTEKMSGMAMSDSTLESISLVPVNEKDQTMTTGGTLRREGLTSTPILEKIKEGSGKAVWIPTMTKGVDGSRTFPTFAVGRYLSLGKQYYLLIEIKQRYSIRSCKPFNSAKEARATSSRRTVHRIRARQWEAGHKIFVRAAGGIRYGYD